MPSTRNEEARRRDLLLLQVAVVSGWSRFVPPPFLGTWDCNMIMRQESSMTSCRCYDHMEGRSTAAHPSCEPELLDKFRTEAAPVIIRY